MRCRRRSVCGVSNGAPAGDGGPASPFPRIHPIAVGVALRPAAQITSHSACPDGDAGRIVRVTDLGGPVQTEKDHARESKEVHR
jgi:hypothetical protein